MYCTKPAKKKPDKNKWRPSVFDEIKHPSALVINARCEHTKTQRDKNETKSNDEKKIWKMSQKKAERKQNSNRKVSTFHSINLRKEIFRDRLLHSSSFCRSIAERKIRLRVCLAHTSTKNESYEIGIWCVRVCRQLTITNKQQWISCFFFYAISAIKRPLNAHWMLLLIFHRNISSTCNDPMENMWHIVKNEWKNEKEATNEIWIRTMFTYCINRAHFCFAYESNEAQNEKLNKMLRIDDNVII